MRHLTMLCALLGALSASAEWTYDATAKTLSDGNWTFVVEIVGRGTQMNVKTFQQGSGDLDMSDLYDYPSSPTVPLLSFPAKFFMNKSDLGAVTFPDTITVVPSGMFESSSLVEFTGLSVKQVSGASFKGCKKLVKVTFGDNFSVIDGENSFSGCSALTTIVPNELKVTRCGRYCFSGTDSLTDCPNFTVLTNVPSYMFNASAITDLRFPVATNIAGYAFVNCTNLVDVTLPAAQSIGGNVFSGCTALKSLVGTNIVSLGSAFYDTKKGSCPLTNVVVSADFRDFAGSVFRACKTLTSFSPSELPNVVKVSQQVFWGATGITNIFFSFPHVKVLVTGAFQESGVRFVDLPEVEEIGEDAFKNSKLTGDVTLPCLTNVAKNAFANASHLTSLTATNLVMVGDYSFGNCTVLTNVVMSAAVRVMGAPGGTSPFSYSKAIESVFPREMPELESVCSSLFSGCSKITGAMRWNSPKLSGVPAGMFNGCRGLSDIYVVSPVTSVGNSAFADLARGERVHFRQPVPETLGDKWIFAQNGEQTRRCQLVVDSPSAMPSWLALNGVEELTSNDRKRGDFPTWVEPKYVKAKYKCNNVYTYIVQGWVPGLAVLVK